MVNKIILLLLIPTLSHALSSDYIIEDLAKEGQVQALKMNSSKKFSVAGGTITGRTFVANVLNITGSGNGICFPDGTCQTTAGAGAVAISVDEDQFNGNGALATPLSLESSSVTLQGNTFNAAGKLLLLDGSGDVPVDQLPPDGYASTYVNASGDTMTGQLTMAGSSIAFTNGGSITGANLVSASSFSASEYWGNISSTTGINQTHKTIFDDAQDPTGFVDRTAALSFNDANYTFTITGDHYIYINGVKSLKTTASIQLTDTTGIHFIYYTAAGALAESMSPQFTLPLVATVYWNTTINKGLIGDERHGAKMDVKTHEYLHKTVGTRYHSGLTGTFADTTFAMTAGTIWDEDLEHSIIAASTCAVLYKNGSADYQFVTAQTSYYMVLGGNIQYNNGNSLASVPSNQYSAVWIFATNDIAQPIISIIGQRTDVTLADARANNTYEGLSLGTLPFAEMKLLYRIILRNDATPYEETLDLRSVSNLPSGTYIASAHSALTGLGLTAAAHPYDVAGGFASYDLLMSTVADRPTFSQAVPYTGATGAVKLGAYSLSTSSSVSAAYYEIRGSTVLSILPSVLANESIGVGPGAGKMNAEVGNTYVGVDAGSTSVTGSQNTFVGRKAGVTNNGGESNTYLGANSGRNNKTGNNNVFVGNNAGGDIAGSNNVFLGYYSGNTNVRSGSNNISIGYAATSSAAVINSYLNIGNAIKGDLTTSSVSVMGPFSAPQICLNGDCQTAWPEGGGGSGGNSWVEENFYSQTNGSQTQFTLSQVPTANSLTLSKNGVVLVSPADYSLSNQLITMVTAPASSTTLVANYAVSIATDIAAIKIDGQPIGTIIAYSTTTPPSGYLYCDGSYVSTSTYADLFAVTGHRYSTFTVTGSPAKFQLPDLRGMFMRGAEGNVNSRDTEPRVVGSTQTDTFQGHLHPVSGGPTTTGTYLRASASGLLSEATQYPTGPANTTDGVNGTPRTSAETRPENTAVAYMIKYAHSGTATIQLATTSVILATNNSFTGSNTFTGAVSVSSITFSRIPFNANYSVFKATVSAQSSFIVSGLTCSTYRISGRLVQNTSAGYLDMLVNATGTGTGTLFTWTSGGGTAVEGVTSKNTILTYSGGTCKVNYPIVFSMTISCTGNFVHTTGTSNCLRADNYYSGNSFAGNSEFGALSSLQFRTSAGTLTGELWIEELR